MRQGFKMKLGKRNSSEAVDIKAIAKKQFIVSIGLVHRLGSTTVHAILCNLPEDFTKNSSA